MENRNNLSYSFITTDVQWAIVASLFFFVTLPFIWIYYLIRFNKYRNSKTITLKGYNKVPINKIDRRYKQGYKTVGYQDKAYYVDVIANGDDLIKNKRKANFLLVLALLNICLSIYILFFLA